MSFVKKKNLKAKKGKEKWRKNIDITEIQETIAEENDKKHSSISLSSKNIKKTPKITYFIDPEPTKLAKSGLPADRFKKKPQAPLTKSQQKVLKVYQKKLERSEIKEKKEKNEDENLHEAVWDDKTNNKGKKKLVVLEKEIKVGNALPQAGQSYNPSYKDHKNLLEEIQHEELEKQTIKHAVSNKTNKKQKNGEKNSKNISEKQVKHQFTLVKKYAKEMKQKSEISLKKIEEREKMKNVEKDEIKRGIIKRPKRIGKNKYQPRIPDFKLSSELSSNLRTINPEGSVLIDAFDNIFKKNLIEPGNPFGAKKRKSRIPKYKYHNTDRKTKDSDEKILGTSFNIYQY